MNIKFIGSPDIVGRAAYLVKEDGHHILLDYGVEVTRPPKFPESISPDILDAVVLTHAHLDHMGAVPYLYVSGSMPLYLTKPTLELAELLVKDFIKLSGEYLPFEYIDFIYMAQRSVYLNYNEEISIPNTTFKIMFKDAGHIPGSCQVILESKSGKRILYTGDMNNYDTRLQWKADIDYDVDFDVVIVESTYGADMHPDRSRLEKIFIEMLSDIIENRGLALIPAFAIGRSQEILLILKQNKFKYKVVMDGMALDATDILLRNKEFLRSPRALRKAYKSIKKVKRWRERKRIIKESCVIIAPAGMLGGGSAVFYLSKIFNDPRNGIFMVGYQAPGTPGRVLLEDGVVTIEEKPERMRAQRYYFEFSSHTDREGLRRFLMNLSGDPLIIIVHGEERGRMGLKDVAEDLGFKTFLPKCGDNVTI